MRESLPPPPLLADVMPDEDVSWSRVVIAIVLLALSVAIGYRTARDPPPPSAVPQPVRERVVAGIELPPLERPAVTGLPFSDGPARATHAPLKAVEHSQPPRVRERSHIVRAASRASGSQGMRARRHQVAFAAKGPRTSARTVRTRAQVRAEYLRAREVVAALTGEDSGSAYLMRVAARQRAARLEGAGRRRG